MKSLRVRFLLVSPVLDELFCRGVKAGVDLPFNRVLRVRFGDVCSERAVDTAMGICGGAATPFDEVDGLLSICFGSLSARRRNALGLTFSLSKTTISSSCECDLWCRLDRGEGFGGCGVAAWEETCLYVAEIKSRRAFIRAGLSVITESG